MTSADKNQLSTYAYYQTGGTCQHLYVPKSVDELKQNFNEIIANGWKYFILGGGTNSLVADAPYDGAVVVLTELNHLEVSGDTFIAQAGVTNTTIAEEALSRGLSGAEWMYYLPGQIGGTARMNARCFGGEISQVTQRIWYLDEKGKDCVMDGGKDVFRGYKDTVFMDHPWLIYQVELQFEDLKESKDAIQKKMQANKDYRDGKGHFNYPSCGCVFKNDYSVGTPSGQLIEAAGCKEWTEGKAMVSPHHANFIYNTGGASADDILRLSLRVREAVHKKHGVWMEYEMELLGDFDEELMQRLRGRPSSALRASEGDHN